MTQALNPKPRPLWHRFWFSDEAPGRASEEQARLEAFLDAFPGEYCGWNKDGQAVYSRGFCDVLGLEGVVTPEDVQSALCPGDGAALDSLFECLKNDGTGFSLKAQSHDKERFFKISGSRGQDPQKQDMFHILWIEDITQSRKAREKLARRAQEKEEKYKLFERAFNSILSPRWLRDKSGALTWVNSAYSDAIGHTALDIIAGQKELAGRARKSKSAKDQGLSGPELALQALKTGEPQESRIHVNVKGQRLLMKIIEIPMPEFGVTLGVGEDISKEEEAQTELKRYVSSNKELLEKLHSAIAIYSEDQRLEFYNSAFSQLWGLEDGWLNTRPALGEIMEKLRETRRLPEQADFRRFKESWMAMFTTLIGPHEDMLYLPNGNAIRMLSIPHSMGGLMMNFEDVTSRLELESSYNTLIAVQKETLDNLGEGVAVYGGDGRLKLWNPAFGRLWHLHPEDLDGEPHINTIVEKLKGLFPPETWDKRRDSLIGKTLDRVMHEGRLARIDDTHLDFSTVPLPDGGVLITYSDVTDTVRVENALREKNAALEAAERLKLDFLANVSYQLRTPLNAIMGFNEILDQEFFGKLNKRQHEYTRDIHAASEKLLGLVNDILDLATLEAGYLDLQREDVALYDFMHNIKDLVSDWARQGQIEIHLKCAKNIGQVTADRKRLKQAVINIIRNAINFTPKGGEIHLSARRLKHNIEITVRDNGIGVDKEARRRIFEPFERAHSGTQDMRFSRSGAGLGLALVKNIIALHGGEVALESDQGKGTTVTVTLPLTFIETPLKVVKKQGSY